ncbi:MAG TPA: divalent-cation tolerance protein CutA [Arenicellales bacterium]|nr:divalent-cation tolerance protein CutA [Arenicellales bacterium]
MTLIDVWINCPDADVAHAISEALVAERLAACTNTFAPIQSAFHWKGRVERESEVPLLVKTRDELFDQLCERVRELHPYETPGIMALRIDRVNDDYHDWVLEETRSPAS